MARKKSSLQSNEVAIDRETTQSAYDAVKLVSDNIELILDLARELARNSEEGITNSFLNSSIEYLQNQVEILNSRLAGLDLSNESVANLVNVTEVLQTNVQEITVNVEENTSGLAQEVNDRAAAVSQAIQDAVDQITAPGGDLDGQFQQITDAIAVVDGDVSAHGVRLLSVEGGVDTLTQEQVGIVNSIEALQTTVNDGNTGVAATYNSAVNLQARLDGTAAGSSGISLEQLAANVASLSGDGSGFATITDLDEVNTNIGINTGRIDTEAQRITVIETGLQTTDQKADSAILRIDNVGSSGNSLEDLQNELSTTAQSTLNLVSAVEHPTTGLLSTYNSSIQTQSRLDDVSGDSSGTTIEQLAAQVNGLSGDGSGFATISELDAVDVRVLGNTGQITSHGSRLLNVEAGVLGAQGDATSSIERLDNVNSSGNSLEQLQNILSTTATQSSTLNSQINVGPDSLSATVSNHSFTLVSIEDDVTTQVAAYAVVVNAGDSDAAIEVTANGGVGSQINLKADRVTIDDGTERTNLFDINGKIDSALQNVFFKGTESGISFTNNAFNLAVNNRYEDLTELSVDLVAGFYECVVSIPFIQLRSNTSFISSTPLYMGFKTGPSSTFRLLEGTILIDADRYSNNTDSVPAESNTNINSTRAPFVDNIHDDTYNQAGRLNISQYTVSNDSRVVTSVRLQFVAEVVTTGTTPIIPYLVVPQNCRLDGYTFPYVTYKKVNIYT